MVSIPNPIGAVDRIRKEVERNALRARNGIKMVAGTTPRLGVSPRDTVWRNGRSRLYHYRNDEVRYRPPLLIVFSLISRAYILDLTPGNSFIEHLTRAGFDVYLLDWGEPEGSDAHNGLEYYVDGALPAAIESVRAHSDCDEINLLGYCFGGNLTLLHGAHHPDAPIRSHTVVACPVDYHEMPLAEEFATTDMRIDEMFNEDGNVPSGLIFNAFRRLQPTAEITGYVDLLDRLWSDDYVAAYQAMNGWATDHIPLAGETARQMTSMLMRDNAFMTDRLMVGGDHVSLRSITAPFLAVLGEKDHIVPPAAAGPIVDLVGSKVVDELRLVGGHIGLVVGRTAAKTTIPTILEFLAKQSEVPA